MRQWNTSRNAANGSTAKNGELCGFEPIVTSCNNRRIVGSGVLCWVRREAIPQGPTGRARQRGQEPLDTEAEDATLLKSANKQRD
jgi:hypothetical protein